MRVCDVIVMHVLRKAFLYIYICIYMSFFGGDKATKHPSSVDSLLEGKQLASPRHLRALIIHPPPSLCLPPGICFRDSPV